jgi:hypothetical protein
MKKSILIAVTSVGVIILIIVGYITYTITENQPPTSPTQSPTPESVIQEIVRDSAIMYIATNHSEIASLTTDLTWTGGRQETGLLGSETYIYIAGGWNVTITNPVVPDPIYEISAVYTDTANQITIIWSGLYQGGATAETSYNYIVP